MASDNSSTSAGYISKIELENFMCHRKFEIDLSPNMNLIVGRNGSGKSSILTALIVGLGGGARTTGRGDNYKALIRHNCTDAYIKLTIRNFRGGQFLGKFGHTFTIQRRIGLKTNSYSIKDINGKTMSTKAQDVRNICLHFGYHPDNVLVMLNQESAKEFLVTATPQVKYARLTKALNVDAFHKTMAEVDKCLEFRQGMKDEIKTQELTLKAKEKSDSTVLENAREMHKAAQEVETLNSVLVWRKIRTLEHQLLEKRKAADASKLQLDSIAGLDDNDHLRELTSRHAVIENDIMPLQSELTSEQQKLQTAESKLRKIEEETKYAKSNVQRGKDLLNKAVRERDDLLKEQEPTGGDKLPELIDKQNELRTKLNEYSRNIADLDSELQSQDQVRSESLAAKRQLDTEISSVRQSIHSEKQSLQQQTGGQANPLIGFGADASKIKQLDELINRNSSQFQNPPVGPLARYIRCTDQKWQRLVENILNPIAWNYWVQSRQDSQLLSRLAKQAGIDNKVNTLLWKAERYSYNQISRQFGYTRFMDCLKFENEYIERIVVDQLNPEMDVLCDSMETALDVSSNTEARYVYCNAKHGEGWSRLSNNRGSRENRPVKPVRYNRVSLQAAVDSPEAARQVIQDRINEYEEKLRDLERRKQEDEGALKEVNDKLQDLQRLKQRQSEKKNSADSNLKVVARQIQDIEKADAENSEVDIATLSNNKEKQIRQRQIELSNLERLVHTAEKELILAKSEAKAKATTVRNIDNQIAAATSQMQQLDQQIHQTQRAQAQKIAQKDVMERRYNNDLAQVEEMMEMLRRNTEAAQASGPRPNLEEYDHRDNEQLRSDIIRLKGLKDQLEKSSINFEQRTRDLDLLRQDLIRIRDHYKRHSDELKSMVEKTNKRRRNAKKQFNVTMDGISKAYEEFIGERNFTGQLTIDQEKKRLIAEANPQSTTGETRSTTTLSGGEKSFTQICLLLSIWSNINTGLVAMDEYDVFMDEVFRAASMEALVQTITGKRAQGILITPQGLPRAIIEKYKDTDIFKVHNLESPRDEPQQL